MRFVQKVFGAGVSSSAKQVGWNYYARMERHADRSMRLSVAQSYNPS